LTSLAISIFLQHARVPNVSAKLGFFFFTFFSPGLPVFVRNPPIAFCDLNRPLHSSLLLFIGKRFLVPPHHYPSQRKCSSLLYFKPFPFTPRSNSISPMSTPKIFLLSYPFRPRTVRLNFARGLTYASAYRGPSFSSLSPYRC